MLVPPKLAGTLTTLVAGAALFLTGCSSSSPRDMNYGTDVGLGYEPTDVAVTTTDGGTQSTTMDDASDLDGGAAVDASIDFSDAVDATNDMDGEAAVDSSIDADN